MMIFPAFHCIAFSCLKALYLMGCSLCSSYHVKSASIRHRCTHIPFLVHFPFTRIKHGCVLYRQAQVTVQGCSITLTSVYNPFHLSRAPQRHYSWGWLGAVGSALSRSKCIEVYFIQLIFTVICCTKCIIAMHVRQWSLVTVNILVMEHSPSRLSQPPLV